jgi:hypothetical protein
MIFKARPINQQQISIGPLDAFLQAVRHITVHAANNILRLAERQLKLLTLSRYYIKSGHFQNHAVLRHLKTRSTTVAGQYAIIWQVANPSPWIQNANSTQYTHPTEPLENTR